MNLKFSRYEVIIFLLAVTLLQVGCKSKDTDEKSPNQQIAEAGYKFYVSKKPFNIFVSDKYPSNQSMMLLSDSNPVAFRFDDDVNTQKRSASASVKGGEVSANIELSQDGSPEELLLIFSLPDQQTQVLRDINLDGTWDVKITTQPHQEFIFINSQWMQVDKVEGHWPNIEAQSKQGSFAFDMKKGQWIPKGQ